jgi:beta-xylosidase
MGLKMKLHCLVAILLIITLFDIKVYSRGSGRNPVIHADVPDISIVRVGNTYYMSSTTMHMSPGLPIMRSNDLINWEIISYGYDILADSDELNLVDGRNAYGRGSWAPSIRYHKGIFYTSTFSGTTGKTYIYKTRDIGNEPWEEISFSPSYHDHTIFFDDDGRVYMIWGVGKLRLAELKGDLAGVIEGSERVIIENASAPAGDNIMLHAEGSQLFKVDDKYYLFNITWPRDGMRTVIIHRADEITGPYESKLALQDRGIAQGDSSILRMVNGILTFSGITAQWAESRIWFP